MKNVKKFRGINLLLGHHGTTVFLLPWWLFFSWIYSQMIQLRSDGIYLGHQNVWSDWSLHIQLANIFRYHTPSEWFQYHPVFADGKLSYPSFANLISGTLMRFNIPLDLAFSIPSIITFTFLLIGLYFFFYKWTQNSKIAVLAIYFYILSSGLNFIPYFYQFCKILLSFNGSASFEQAWNYLRFPPHQISEYRNDWLVGNVAVGLLVPQRAFLLGLTIGIWTTLGFLNGITKQSSLILLLAGLGMGAMPSVHAHTFIALSILIFYYWLIFGRHLKWKILWFLIPCISIFLILYRMIISGNIQNANFMKWSFGWTSHGIWDWLTFWFWVWSPAIPIVVHYYYKNWRQLKEFSFLNQKLLASIHEWFSTSLSLLTHSKAKEVHFGIPFLLLFFIANLIQFQPISWDNTKIFWWVYLGFSVIAAERIVQLWETNKLISIVLSVLMSLTGLIEIHRLSQIDRNTSLGWTKEEVELGEYVRRNTPTFSRFLTAPIHNHPISTWGVRPILLGYPGWAYNFGFLTQGLENDIQQMFRCKETECLKFLNHHHVNYIVFGPSERNTMNGNEPFYAQIFPLVFSSVNYKIYKVQ